MPRNGKYGTNKTIRYCSRCAWESHHNCSECEVSIDKRKRWILIDLLKEYSHSPDPEKKIIVRRNCNFHQYNGYPWSPKRYKRPPKHVAFAVNRPDFVYQPYVQFLKVDHELFEAALRNGLSLFEKFNNLEQLLDNDSSNAKIMLIYFLNGSGHCFSSDWHYASRHANGGHFADYSMVCSGDYCPFGPKIRAHLNTDSRICQILYVATANEQHTAKNRCAHVGKMYSKKNRLSIYKEVRRQKKSQRHEGREIMKNLNDYGPFY